MDKLAGRLLASSLSFDDVRVFYQIIYTPSIRYVLPALSVDDKHLEEIQTRSLEAILVRQSSSLASTTNSDEIPSYPMGKISTDPFCDHRRSPSSTLS